ncbi:MAG: exonuclease domain-containing protein [Hyphomicrobiaceae bacterium]|nr:exonuclease domain-containing protein [Hyphomicrobiaceae bacterium]
MSVKPDRLSLRTKVALVFVAIGVAIPLAVGAALTAAAQRIAVDGEIGSALVLFGGLACIALLGLLAGLWIEVDEHVAKPILALARDAQTVLHAKAEHRLKADAAPHLGPLGPTMHELTSALVAARGAIDERIEAAVRDQEAQRLRLEAILRDLVEGVIICTLDHKLLLYNHQALTALHAAGSVGLGRSLFEAVIRAPFATTLERLMNRLAAGRHLEHPDRLMAPIVFATVDGQTILEGKLSLVLDGAGATASGYVVTFSEATRRLAALSRADRIVRDGVEGLRRPVANLRAAIDVAADQPADAAARHATDTEARARFLAIAASEVETLSERLQQFDEAYRATVAASWPTSDVRSDSLLSCLTRRFRESPEGPRCDLAGEPHWLNCDATSIIELMDDLTRRVAAETGAKAFSVRAEPSGGRIALDIVWRGDPVASHRLDQWLSERLAASIGGMTGREVLEHHKSAAWSDRLPGGDRASSEPESRIRMPLPAPVAPHTTSLDGAPPIRLEFYDFDLLKRPGDTGDLMHRRLRDLSYVVFDTETTGLEPSKGDEIVSLAGVRIVNSRVLTGETFTALVDPGRRIPPRATMVHRITDAMVQGKPPLSAVLRRFREFVGDSVLVAHNAAFDLRFIELKEAQTGIRLDRPVLDTVLLSALVHDHTDQHTLDAVAERFAVEIPPDARHTALGDSLVTAGVFVRLLDLLEAGGIATLGDALSASERLVAIRRSQARY